MSHKISILLVTELQVSAGLEEKQGNLSHKMSLSNKGYQPECDNVNKV